MHQHEKANANDQARGSTNPLESKPLAGIRVVELGQNIAGPYAGEILAMLGAQVVKVERPGTGDDARGWGPPFVHGVATTFEAMNHGKQSVTVDLQSPDGMDWLKQLIAHSDIFLHNMRPGSLDAVGLGAEQLRQQFPSLIYCELGAFGHLGPLHLRPGYEPMIQAFSGIFSVNGAPEGPTSRVGMQILDLGTGVWGALGCLLALYHRTSTKQGMIINASLFETALGWLQVILAAFSATKKQTERHRSGNPKVVVFQAFNTLDGEVVVAAANDRLFIKLVQAMGLDALVTDGRFGTNASRVAHKDLLIPQLEVVFLRETSAHWEQLLEAAGVPCAPINDLAQMLSQEQTKAINLIQPTRDSGIEVVALPISLNRSRPAVDTRAPLLGEHNQVINELLNAIAQG
jgi:crotonobetainyl-CoA:carnitine CoA-transferase CaiB-like acyl-CoA transferase